MKCKRTRQVLKRISLSMPFETNNDTVYDSRRLWRQSGSWYAPRIVKAAGSRKSLGYIQKIGSIGSRKCFNYKSSCCVSSLRRISLVCLELMNSFGASS